MTNTGTIKLNGKIYRVDVENGIRYIDGKTLDQFVETLDAVSLVDCAKVGIQVVRDILEDNHEKTYQQVSNELYQERNN